MHVFNHASNSLKQMIPNRLSRQRRIRRLQKLIAASETLNVIMGAGPTKFAGWVETDRDILNIASPEDWRRLFAPASIDRLLSEHVFEHLDEADCRIALRECRRYLKPGGRLRLAVPDGFHPDPSYLDSVKPGGSGPGAEDHKVLYDYQMLNRIAAEEGFDCELLEYFDEQGEFHRASWDAADGFVERSVEHDPRNQQRPLSYTSLIADLHPQPQATANAG